MKRIALAVAIGAVVFTAGSSFFGVISAKAGNLKIAQVEIQVGRDRDVREERGGKQKIIVDKSRAKKSPTHPSTKLSPQPEPPNIPQAKR
jgi:hypothetical protein